MTNKEITYILMQHFSKQISCDADDFLKNENTVILRSDTLHPFFKMCCFGNSAEKCGYYPAWVVMDSMDIEWANEILYGKTV